jgi:replication factor A1
MRLSMARMNDLSIEGKFDTIKEPRAVNLGTVGTARVADAIISDETGQIRLGLWDDQINLVRQGDNITIDKGYTEFLGEVILCVPRSGKISKY